MVAADLPFIGTAIGPALLDRLEADAELDAVVPAVDGRLQPLCAGYRARAAGIAAGWLREAASRPGGASMHGLLERLRTIEIDPATLGDVGDPEIVFRGIDTPEDLAWARGAARG